MSPPRGASQRTSTIEDDDDINLDDIDTLPHDDDDEPPADDEPEPEEGDEPAEGEEDEPVEGEGDEPVRVQQLPRSSRGERRQQHLANENRELRTNMEALQRRFDDFVRSADATRREQQRETPDQRQQRRALMTPEERAAEDIRESETRVGNVLSNAQMQIADTADKSAFDVLVRSDKLYSRLAQRVETELAGLRAKGQNAPREAILKFIIGDEALKQRAARGNRSERQAAQRRVQRQQTRPGDTRDDVRLERRGRGKSLEDRLADQPI